MLRKFIEALLAPFSLTVFAMALGLMARFTSRPRLTRIGSRLVIFGFVGLLGLAYGIPFDFIGSALEHRYPPILDTTDLSSVRWILVLGSSTAAHAGEPVTSFPRGASYPRILEGVRLQRAIPTSRLVFSGYAGGSELSSAEVGAIVARSLGVPDSLIVQEPRPKTTADEARLLGAIVGHERFLLVTSALHMPRAMMLFGARGLAPVPAPTGHVIEMHRKSVQEWITPSPDRIAHADATFHEMLGIAAAKLRL